MKKIICVLLAVCLLVLSVGCDSTKTTQSEDLGDSSATPPEIRLSVKETLDLVLSAQEQEKFSKVIDNAFFTHHPSWSSVYYWGIADAIDEISKIGLKGLPVLMVKAIEPEDSNDSNTRDDIAEGVALSHYRLYASSAILRVTYDSVIQPNKYVAKPSENYYTYWKYAKEELPEISVSDISSAEKLSAYREFGIFAVPYVVEEIEKGCAELEPFFTLIGAHLSTAEYMHITDITDPEKYANTPPPTDKEIDAILLEGGKDFDYKVWYEENKEDLDNLFKFLDAYCAEYEAEQYK